MTVSKAMMEAAIVRARNVFPATYTLYVGGADQ